MMCYKPTISYPLHHTTFTDKECPFLRVILPKMGFNRNFPRAVVHGPYALGGIQTIDVKVEQFVLQLVDMMTAIHKMDIIGEQLVYLIAAHQRFLGTSTQFFAPPPPSQILITTCRTHILCFFGKRCTSMAFRYKANISGFQSH